MVRFNDANEFLKELAKDRDHVERRIVRLTNLYRPSQRVPSIQHLSVVATTRVGRELVRLETYCGDLWNLGRDQSVLDKAKVLHQTIEDGCASLGLEVRSGVLDDEEGR